MVKGKKVLIVTNSSSYEPRAERIGSYLKKQGCSVAWIQSDFIHREKEKLKREKEDHLYIDTIPYKKNLSVSRLYSHYDFAVKAQREMKRQGADLLYVLLPANSLAGAAVKAANKLNCRLVFDVIDLWPESLRLGKMGKLPPFKFWRNLRDNWLPKADLVITECDFYHRYINVADIKTMTMYWHKEQKAEPIPFAEDKDCLHFVYLGSINYIIDISRIVEIMETVQKTRRAVLHVIGDGENRELFESVLKEREIKAIFYGAIYDEEEKKKLFSKCSFGFNLMKPGVCVGMTMKSIDYFCYGIPIVNNIPGDTWELVDRYGIGINCDDGVQAGEMILKYAEELQKKRAEIRSLYTQYFTVEAMEARLEEAVLPLLNQR